MQTVHRWRKVASAAAMAAAVVGTVAGFLAPVASAQGGSGVEVDRILRDGTAVHVQLTVPTPMGQVELPPGTVRVTTPAGDVPATGARFGGDRPQLVLALDAHLDPAALAQLRAAVLQTLSALPSEALVSIVTGAGVVDAGTDRQAAATAVEALTADPAAPAFSTVLRAALASPPTDVDRRAVIAASAPRADDRAAAGIEVRQVRDTVWSIQLAPTARIDRTLADLARATGGDLVALTSGDALAGAFDRVRSALERRYEVTYEAPRGGQAVITLETPGGPQSAAVDVPAGSSRPSVAAPAPGHRPATRTLPRSSSPWWWLGGLAVLLAAWGLLFGVVLRTRVRVIDPTDGPAGPTPPPQPGDAATSSGDEVVDLTRLHGHETGPLPRRRPARRDRTGQLGDAAVAALDELHELRRRSPAVVTPTVVAAFESAASAWLDDPDVRVDDAYAVLAGDELPPDDTVPAVLRGIRTGLLLEAGCPDAEVPDHLYAAMAGAARAPEPDLPPVAWRRVAAPLPARRAPADLREAVRLAASVERDGRYGRAGGVVARALLATWPHRHGHLDRCPLLLSPSASPPDGARLSDLDPGEHVDLLLWAVGDAANRMMAAQRTTAGLVADYRRVAEDLAPGQAALVTELVTTRVVTLRAMREALGVANGAAEQQVVRWVDAERLAEVAPGVDGTRRWLAMPIVDAVTATLADAGLPLSPFGLTVGV